MSAPAPASNIQSPPAALRYRWAASAFFAALLLALGYLLARSWWPHPHHFRWLALTALALAYLLWMLWRSLDQNHRPGETVLLPTLGIGNVLSILRGLLMAALFGFLFAPRPGGADAPEWRAWLPGILYTLAALPDYLDGYLARITNHVTKLGETLDMNVDSIGVFTATFLAVQYGTVPWWYLPIGLARYLFLAGIWLREKRGLPVYELPFSVRRRGFAALKMGFMFVMLFPAFGPPGTHLAAAAFGIPFALGFLWDWLIVSGALSPDAGARYPALKDAILRWVPVLLRAFALLLVLPQIGRHLGAGLLPLAALEITAALLLAFGVAGRSAAILAVILIGVNQNLAPLTLAQSALVFAYIGLIFLGTGAFSLWPIEDRLVYRRIGDDR